MTPPSTIAKAALRLSVVIISLCSILVESFQTQYRPINIISFSTRLHESCHGRRNFLGRGAAAIASALVTGTSLGPRPAGASYSAYAHREEDWKQREEKGEIKFSSAQALRQQLREIAPMNDEGSKIFCPNGPSAAVSPLMENKCGDRMAMPSVYGRADDAMGNSIPGFGASASTLRAELSAQMYFRAN